MTEPTDARKMLDKLQPGAEIKVKLDDGSEVAGTFKGLDGDQVQLEDREDVPADRVKTVAMELSSAGPE
jgi:TusA-related sulfurtransferase